MDRRGMLSNFFSSYAGAKALPEYAVKRFLRQCGLSAPKGVFVPRGVPLPDLSNLTFPVVAKVSSSQIRSKSDVDGLRLGLADTKAVETAISELMVIEQAEGALVEEQAAPGVEVIIGGITDPQFGPVVMFGLGGVFVELFHDVAFAPAPMTRDDAFRLVRRVTAYRLLTGYRGKPPCDMEALAGILVTVSELMATGLLEEIDLNPVVLYPHGAMILDAKMMVAS
ncbi:MAG: acetate--CoA ligase family protein [Geobacteraceae bacterium]|nr:acetate--CoA ligase family protein [Geobacteraceae bacterium]